jgi:hypothetical protein
MSQLVAPRNLLFRPTSAGDVAFFPCGLLGPGYVLSTDALVQRARRASRYCKVGMLLLCLVAGTLRFTPVSLFGLPIGSVGWVSWVERFTRGLATVSSRHFVSGIWGNQAVRVRLLIALALELGLLLPILGGLKAFRTSSPAQAELLFMGLLGSLVIALGHTLRLNWSVLSTHHDRGTRGNDAS